MEHQQKRVLFIGLGLVLIFGLTLVITSYFDRVAPSQISVSDQTLIQPKEKLQESKLWMDFDSKKDTGLTLDIQFRYPATWIQNGSRDSGAVSVVPFFDKNKYSKKCETVSNGSVICPETGLVAQLVISNSSYTDSKVTYKEQKSEKVTVDGRAGTKILGVVKSENLSHIALVGQKETRVVVEGVDGQRYEFVMVTENSTQDELFNEIINSTKFGDK